MFSTKVILEALLLAVCESKKKYAEERHLTLQNVVADALLTENPPAWRGNDISDLAFFRTCSW